MKKESKPKHERDQDQAVEELLLQALETERGGIQIYETAIRCAQNKDLKQEWQEYLEQTQHHAEVVGGLLEQLGIDAEKQTLGRKIVRHKGEALVKAMELALSGPPEAAQLVAAECVVEAETKDHLNWELIGKLGNRKGSEHSAALREAHDEVEDEEDEHLYHSAGWARELWIESLGLPAVLPPPEEQKDVKTAIGAARAKQDRKKLL